ncbi:MAG TPA: alpha/beta hydrolase [Clostridia bacterium]
MFEWSIRSLLNPVITRLLIYGVNPIDVEYVVSKVEKINNINSKSLEKTWVEEWTKKAERYIHLAENAGEKNSLSLKDFYFYASQCYYAIFLINLSNFEDKKNIYFKYAELYRKSISNYNTRVELIQVPIGEEQFLYGYLHLPDNNAGENSCVIIYSGLGSCKEEMHTLARPLVERGLAVFVADMPGNGESLFRNNVKCRISNLNASFTRIIDFLERRSDIKKGSFGAYGLCMGGGYAYKAASMDKRYSFLTTLFPLFITQVDSKTTPQWMKQGEWFNYQTGNMKADDFMNELKDLEDSSVYCPFLFVHGEGDNWMTLESAMSLYEKASNEKEKIIITEEPVFSNDQIVTHTMPVGEQLHWIKLVVADWMLLKSIK